MGLGQANQRLVQANRALRRELKDTRRELETSRIQYREMLERFSAMHYEIATLRAMLADPVVRGDACGVV